MNKDNSDWSVKSKIYNYLNRTLFQKESAEIQYRLRKDNQDRFLEDSGLVLDIRVLMEDDVETIKNKETILLKDEDKNILKIERENKLLEEETLRYEKILEKMGHETKA